MFGEEGRNLLPAVVRGLDLVGRAVDGEEAVPGAVVAVELVGEPVLSEDGIELSYLLGAWVRVVLAEQPEQRRAQGGQPVDQVGDVERMVCRRDPGHEGAIAVDGRVDLETARDEHALPSARTVSDDTDLA